MRVTVASDVCVGSGYCRRIAPGVFDLDDDGVAFVIEPQPKGPDEAAALEAELSCPSMSISVEQADVR